MISAKVLFSYLFTFHLEINILLVYCYLGMGGEKLRNIKGAPLKRYEKDLGMGPSGTGGWLIFVAIGLAYRPMVAIAIILQYSFPFNNDDELWYQLTSPNSEYYQPFFALLNYFELIGNIIMVLLGFLLLYLFIKRKRVFPTVYFWFLLGGLLFAFVDELLYNNMFINEGFGYNNTLQSVIFCAIWLPYLKKSVRVKNTFIE